MIFTYFLNFSGEFSFLVENTNLKQNIFNLSNIYTIPLIDFSLINFNLINFVSYRNYCIIIDFLNQTKDALPLSNLENLKTIYHYSIPNTKLAYPEPFVASASLMHSDL